MKPAYNPQAARRAKTEIVKLTVAGTITMKSAAAYRTHHGSLTISSGGQLLAGCEWIAAVAGDLPQRLHRHGAE